jgi:hypothetical protein
MNPHAQILDCVLVILVELASDQLTRNRTVAGFVSAFPTVIEHIADPSLRKLYELTTLYLNEPENYRRFAEDGAFLVALGQCFGKETNHTELLRLFYLLCTNSAIAPKLLNAIHQLCDLMSSGRPQSAILSAFCVAALISKSENPHRIVLEYSPQIRPFLANGLNVDSETTAAAISMAGVLSKMAETAPVVEDWGLQELIVAKLSSPDARIVTLALQQILAMSAILPDTRGLSQAVLPLFQLLEAGKYGNYPILCIENLTVIPENAAIAAKFLKFILNLVDHQPDIAQDAIVILHRIVIAPESAQWMDQSDIAEKFIETMKNKWKENDMALMTAMLYHFASLPIPCKIMKENGVIEMVNDALAHQKFDDINRPQLLRIRSHLSRPS